VHWTVNRLKCPSDKVIQCLSILVVYCKCVVPVPLPQTPGMNPGAAVQRCRASCRGWEVWSIRDDSFAVILPSPCTTSTVSRGHPGTLLAFFISLFSLFLSAAAMLLLQKATPQKMADAATESKKVFRSSPCTPKDLSLLSRKSLLCPSFYYYFIFSCKLWPFWEQTWFTHWFKAISQPPEDHVLKTRMWDRPHGLAV